MAGVCVGRGGKRREKEDERCKQQANLLESLTSQVLNKEQVKRADIPSINCVAGKPIKSDREGGGLDW